MIGPGCVTLLAAQGAGLAVPRTAAGQALPRGCFPLEHREHCRTRNIEAVASRFTPRSGRYARDVMNGWTERWSWTWGTPLWNRDSRWRRSRSWAVLTGSLLVCNATALKNAVQVLRTSPQQEQSGHEEEGHGIEPEAEGVGGLCVCVMCWKWHVKVCA